MFFLNSLVSFFFFGHSGAEMQKYLQAICDAARFFFCFNLFFLVHSGAELERHMQAIRDAARCAPPETAEDHLLFFFWFTVGQNWRGTSATPRDAPPEIVVSKTLRYY